MMTFSFDLLGELDGHPVKLRRYCGRAKRIDITSPIVPHLDLGFSITRAGIVSRVSEWLGKQDIQLDDPELDRAFTIRGDEPARVRALLGPELRVAIAASSAPNLEISDAEYSCGGTPGSGIVESVADLTHELRQAVRIARAVGSAHAVIPRAAALAEHHDVWSEYARANRFQFGSTPLWMQGKLGKTVVLARASRNRENDFSIEASAWLEQPPEVPLAIAPKQGLIETMMGTKPAPTGDAAFDATFAVTHGARADLVDADLRQALLALAQVGSVSLRGSHVRVGLSGSVLPARIPVLLEELRAVLAILERNTSGANAAYR
jgi:hypothetical protein